jgi:hypothetical protein
MYIIDIHYVNNHQDFSQEPPVSGPDIDCFKRQVWYSWPSPTSLCLSSHASFGSLLGEVGWEGVTHEEKLAEKAASK